MHDEANGAGLPAWVLETGSSRHSTETCLRALTMLSSGHSQSEIGRELGVPRSTVGLWARRAREEGGLKEPVVRDPSDNVVEFVRFPENRAAPEEPPAEEAPAGPAVDFLSGFLDTYAGGGSEVLVDGFGFDDLSADDASSSASSVADSIRVVEGSRAILGIELADPFPDEEARSLLESAVRRTVTSALRRSGSVEIDATLLREAAGLHGALVAVASEETDRWPGGTCVLRTARALFRFTS